MKIDCHQHFWSLANPFTRWPTPDLEPIFRDFGPADLEQHLIATGVTGTVLVQAAPSVEETEYLLRIASESDVVKAVVGWIDFDAIGAVEQLRQLSQNPWFKGVRPMIQDIVGEGWILRPEFAGIFDALLESGLRFDALVRHGQIAEIGQLARRYPDLPIVLDHGGKPPVAPGDMSSWTKHILDLGQIPSVYCKLSGFWTEAGADHGAEVIRPYVDQLLASFGPDRLMWGSDWPVLELTGSYEGWLDQCELLLADLSDKERSAIFGKNGMRFYGIDQG